LLASTGLEDTGFDNLDHFLGAAEK
jgi:hypothetical protein